MTPTFLLKVIAFGAIFFSAGWAQSAKCGSGFDWNQNSLGQDPCNVTAMVQSSCFNLVFIYQPLNASESYPAPNSNNSCECNTVLYSLLMACTSCQGGHVTPWNQWDTSCDDVYVSQYPANIAFGTAIPNWAYYNITSLPDQTYNDTVAMGAGRDPERVPNTPKTVNVPSGTSSTIGTSSLTETSHTGVMSTITTSQNPTNTSNTTKSGTNVGAIAGGVVGSVAFLAILATVALWYMRRRRRLQAELPRLTRVGSHNGELAQLALYDPSDPSTFPPSNLPSLTGYTTPSNNTTPKYTGRNHPGVPEL